MPLGAVVVVPTGDEDNPAKHYPVVYTIWHFGERTPFGFTFDGCDKAEFAQARTT